MSSGDPQFTSVATVILASGKGTRMASDVPKVLHCLGGSPMLHHTMAATGTLSPSRRVVVVGHGAEAVAASAAAFDPEVETVLQAPQRGTGHAAQMALPLLAGFAGDLYVFYGDMPLLRPETLARIAAERRAGADFVLLGFDTPEPGRFGRLILEDGRLERIVEAKDATPAELAVTACNAGAIAGDAATYARLLGQLTDDNAQGEYYLTDVIALARAEDAECRVVFCDPDEAIGINTRAELAVAEAAFQSRARAAAMAAGATLIAPETIFFSRDTALGRDVTVHPNVVFGPGVTVGAGTEIRPFCHLEGARVGANAVIGPFARLRPGADLGDSVHIGNYVEVKNAVFGTGAKANHLTYVGDASVGAGVNLGAGTITCNYDGFSKHRTEIGDGAFVGVNAALIAPVTIGAGAYVATGTTVTADVPEEALAIARVPQTNRPGLATRLRKTLAARKKARQDTK
ncbi:MAG: bifunctional UDP-N-acetylglucosamine diphosphorylase/glucosamine-1-phosphate N-acetyltransferase GlmU [Pseudomonadota bacterium]